MLLILLFLINLVQWITEILLSQHFSGCGSLWHCEKQGSSSKTGNKKQKKSSSFHLLCLFWGGDAVIRVVLIQYWYRKSVGYQIIKKKKKVSDFIGLISAYCLKHCAPGFSLPQHFYPAAQGGNTNGQGNVKIYLYLFCTCVKPPNITFNHNI